MNLPPLTNGTILCRYKRFLADVRLGDGTTVTAHCANTGAMTGCWEPGAPVQLSHSDNPRRKLKWTLERVDMGGGWIGVNTLRVNSFISSFVKLGAIPGYEDYAVSRTEPRYAGTDGQDGRFDLLLEASGRPACYVEVKNTTLLNGSRVCFPDARTVRGKKHLELLEDAVKRGYRALMLYAINRPEGESFQVARDVDPQYDTLLKRVTRSGVETAAIRIVHAGQCVRPGEMLPVRLD